MEKFKRLTGEDRLLIIGIPILVVLTVGGWLIWHATAELDDIEERTLQISSVLTMTREHLVLVVISALLVIATAVPLGIVLTRKSTKFMAPIITSITAQSPRACSSATSAACGSTTGWRRTRSRTSGGTSRTTFRPSSSCEWLSLVSPRIRPSRSWPSRTPVAPPFVLEYARVIVDPRVPRRCAPPSVGLQEAFSPLPCDANDTGVVPGVRHPSQG